MQTQLITKGIIQSNGEINKDKINLISGAMVKPFTEMVWVSSGGDMDTINRITEIFLTMSTPGEQAKLFKIIQAMFGMMGVQFSDEAIALIEHKKALRYFLFSFAADFGEIIKEYLDEMKANTLA